MTNGKYRVTVNGFWCRNGTWDDPWQWDGKQDEVFIDVNVKVVNSSGVVELNFNSESELMGDTWLKPNRIQAGSASDRGGLVDGDKFPDVADPWRRSGAINTLRFPPYTVWEGDLVDGGETIMLTPTIWEWDPDAGAWNGWLEWLVSVDEKYGKRAKDIFGGIWPVAKPVFDAVSLGIQTSGTLIDLWGPLGSPGRRPIGTQRDATNVPHGFVFNPVIIALNSNTAEYLSGSNLQGYGQGIVELRYVDDPHLRGVYSLFVQVEKLSGAGVPDVTLQSNWRWCPKCQGLFFAGPEASTSAPSSVCPAGGEHTAPLQSGSGNYSLPHNVPPSAERQDQWRWCSKCQGLYWGPAVDLSRCPAGETHAPAAISGSGNYGLPHNAPPAGDRQDQWRWCPKCQGLFFGDGTSSACPAGTTHTPPAESRSGNYSLPHQP